MERFHTATNSTSTLRPCWSELVWLAHADPFYAAGRWAISHWNLGQPDARGLSEDPYLDRRYGDQTFHEEGLCTHIR